MLTKSLRFKVRVSGEVISMLTKSIHFKVRVSLVLHNEYAPLNCFAGIIPMNHLLH